MVLVLLLLLVNLLTSSQSQRGFHVSLPFFAVASFLWVFVAVVVAILVVAALRIYCLRFGSSTDSPVVVVVAVVVQAFYVY